METDNQNEKSSSGPSILIQVSVFGVIIFLTAVAGWKLINSGETQLESGFAPDFSITSFEGETITLSQYRGQVVVLNFWASWCPPCREEAAYLEQTWREYKDRGVMFIGIDYADTDADALAYIDEFDITYFNGPDLGIKISKAYQMQGVPETYLIDKNGEIKHVHIGPLYPPTLEQLIEELLEAPFSPAEN